MTDTDRAWDWTALLLGIHQSEEVALSIAAWLSDVGTTGIGWFDEHIRTNPLAGTNPAARAGVVAGQGVALWVVYRLTRDSRTLTRWVTSSLVLSWAAAFCMHLGMSARTRSFMPGTATSIIPGIPGAIWVLRRIRELTA